MNKFALLPFFLLLFCSAKAQDKIISINHDTIHCTILSIGNESILYEQKNNDGSITGKLMPLSQVAEYMRSSHQPGKKSEMYDPKRQNSLNIPQKRFYFGLNVGGSIMPWYLDYFQSFPSAMPSYYNKLKTGFHINANVHYMIRTFWGLGVEYLFFKTSTNGSSQYEYYPSMFLIESEERRLYINYVGASVLFQQNLNAKGKFVLKETISGGGVFIRSENQIVFPNVTEAGYNDISNNTLLTGNSFTGKLGLAAEYRIFKAFSAGVGADFIWCSLKKASFESKGSNNYSYSSDKQKLSSAMNLSRIDYFFVLGYHF